MIELADKDAVEEKEVQVDRVGGVLQIAVRGALAEQVLDMINIAQAVENTLARRGQLCEPADVVFMVVRGIIEQGLATFQTVYLPVRQ